MSVLGTHHPMHLQSPTFNGWAHGMAVCHVIDHIRIKTLPKHLFGRCDTRILGTNLCGTKCKRGKHTASTHFLFVSPFFGELNFFPFNSHFFSVLFSFGCFASVSLCTNALFFFPIPMAALSVENILQFVPHGYCTRVYPRPPPMGGCMPARLPNSFSAIISWTTSTVMLFVLLIYKLGLRVRRCWCCYCYCFCHYYIFRDFFSIHISFRLPSCVPIPLSRCVRTTTKNNTTKYYSIFSPCVAHGCALPSSSFQTKFRQQKKSVPGVSCFFLLLPLTIEFVLLCHSICCRFFSSSLFSFIISRFGFELTSLSFSASSPPLPPLSLSLSFLIVFSFSFFLRMKYDLFVFTHLSHIEIRIEFSNTHSQFMSSLPSFSWRLEHALYIYTFLI